MTTLVALADGLWRHLVWWGGAVLDWHNPRAPLRARRALFLVAGVPVGLAVQSVHGVCLLLDEILFPRYRRVEIGRALFITGLPRSGTSFVHRTLALETQRYTTLTTWEALFAPSILQRRLVRRLARIDRALGGHTRSALETLTRRLGTGLEPIHAVGLRAAEEDYLVLLPAGGCFLMLLAFPGAGDIEALGHFGDRVPQRRQRRLLRFYRRCLQRHLYADGGARLLLSKNAAFGSWLGALHAEFPHARFLVCVREPARALSSQISAVASARQVTGVEVDHAAFQQAFVALFTATLEHLASTLQHWPPERAAVIDLDDLGAAPAEVVTAALTRLGLAPGPVLQARLDTLPHRPSSAHAHDIAALAIAGERLESATVPVYQHLLNLPHRIRTAP